MSRPTRMLAGILGVVALMGLRGGAAAPPAIAGDPCYHGFDMPAVTVGTGPDIKAMPCAFAPTVTAIATGEHVTFFNGPEVAHLVTGANQAWGERDVQLAPHATVTYSFADPGVYPYACALHPGMSGAIVVGDGGEALAAAIAPGAAGPAAPGAGAKATTDGAAAPGTDAPTTAGLDIGLAAGGLLLLLGGVLGGGVVTLMRRRRVTTGAAAEPLAR